MKTRRRAVGTHHPEVGPGQPPAIAAPRARDVDSLSRWRGWWHDHFDLALSPFGPLYSLFMIAVKWVMTLMFLGAAFVFFGTVFGLPVSITGLSPAHGLGDETLAAALGMIFLALGAYVLLLTPEEVSDWAMRRFRRR